MSYPKDLKDRIAKLGESIADGACASFEEYKSKVGERRGLKAALAMFEERRGDPEDDSTN